MNLTLLDFAPLIMATIVSIVGLGFIKLLVYLHHRHDPRHGGKGGR